jgi:hypothetical protein
MPYVSQAQEGWAHSPAGEKALGKAGVAEWDAATKGKHLPKRVQHFSKGGLVMALSSESKGSGPKDAEFAVGGGSLDRVKDFKKDDPQGRGDFGRFLSTKDRFTNREEKARVSGARQSQTTSEDWTKPKGVGHTEKDDFGDTKSLPPIKPRG